MRTALISNFPSHQAVVDIARRLGVADFFRPLVSSAQWGHIKPHPSIFARVLQEWDIDGPETVMVGDSLEADVLGATGVGMRSILVDIEPNPGNA